jgi:hypothetical protein
MPAVRNAAIQTARPNRQAGCRSAGRIYIGGCSSPFNQPVALSVLSALVRGPGTAPVSPRQPQGGAQAISENGVISIR